MRFLENEKDWKDDLDLGAQETLKMLIDSTKSYSSAYMKADDVKTAQLWTALVIMESKWQEAMDRIELLERPWRALTSIGDIEKRRTIEKILSNIISPIDTERQEILQKLTDSLLDLE